MNPKRTISTRLRADSYKRYQSHEGPFESKALEVDCYIHGTWNLHGEWLAIDFNVFGVWF